MHRLEPFAVAPAQMKAWYEFSMSLKALEPGVQELVKIRSSQINGCARCLQMHTADARKAGESDERLFLLEAWRETEGVYTEREQAALAWTESLTRLAEKGAPDDVYERLEQVFNAEEQVELTLLINVINGWNRLGVGFAGPVRSTAEIKAA